MEYTTLSNGVKMPMLGYGVYQVSPQECERCVLDALHTGYRSLDTAQSYFNEAQVGSAIRKSGVPREDIFLTTKVWVEHYGQKAARASVLDSMQKLGVDYLDLVLLHQPFADYYGGRWKNSMTRDWCGPSACPIFIPTGWWTWPASPVSGPW